MNDPATQVQLREAFRQGISIVKLEGWEPQADFHAVQERVVAGELTFDEAVKIVLSEPLLSCPRFRRRRRPLLGWLR